MVQRVKQFLNGHTKHVVYGIPTATFLSILGYVVKDWTTRVDAAVQKIETVSVKVDTHDEWARARNQEFTGDIANFDTLLFRATEEIKTEIGGVKEDLHRRINDKIQTDKAKDDVILQYLQSIDGNVRAMRKELP